MDKLKMLDTISKSAIEMHNQWVFTVFEQIGKIIENATESLENPLIGVFYKSHFDHIETLRRYYKQIRKIIKRNIKNYPQFYNALGSEKTFANKFVQFSKEVKQYLIVWSKKLKDVSYVKEKELLKKVTEFNEETMNMQSKFTLLVKTLMDDPLQENILNICPKCNKEVDDETVFCKYCGVKIQGKTRYIPEAVKHDVWIRDDGQCVICGTKENLQFDHIIPFDKGGSSTSENLQILCKTCNLKKSNKI